MKEQNFKNHSKWVIGYHLITFLAILGLIIGSIRHLIYTDDTNLYPASLLVLVAFILFFIFYFVRAFALRAQDRAISAEEKFRYYILTGKTLNDGLTIRQIIGLRFASDKEFPALAEKAEKENLSEKEIKKAIQDWKPDMYRA
jgi:cbb3-type cytochrome oxidase subunit 3